MRIGRPLPIVTWSIVIWSIISVSFAAAAPPAEEAKGVSVRVAAVSFVPKKFDLPGNADRLERAFRLAKKGHAKIAVAPEGALDGYVVNEIIAGSAAEERMNEVAISIDDPLIQRFQKLARELEMCLAFGLAERIGDDVFNCAVFIDHEGRIRGKYHKMQFAEGYDPAWWFNRLGTASRAFDTPYGRCGLLICNDRWNPQLARIPVLDGARYLIIPSFGSRSEAQDKTVLSRGQENGVPVIEANVGVTLVVDGGKITAVDRQNEGITFGQITIPPATQPKPEQRKLVEQEFLKWRGEEMQRRLTRTRERQQHRRQQAIDQLKKLGARIQLDERGHVIEVNLQETKTTDDDLAHLAALYQLQELSLHQTKVSGAGLVHLKGLSRLKKLFLTDTRTDDGGLAHLSGLQELQVLGLSGTKVSDAGIVHLKKLTGLSSLFLIDAQVTPAGAKKLNEVLPACEIAR